MLLNAERAKENPNHQIVASSGMFANLTAVLLGLCVPFIDPNSPKSKLIQLEYLQSVEYRSVYPQDVTTLLRATESVQFEHRDANFITQCFFLTCRAIHLGPVAVMHQYKRMMQNLMYLQNHMEGNPAMEANFERLAVSKMLLDAFMLEEKFLLHLVQFSLLSATVLCRLCCPQGTLPLTLPPPHLRVPTRLSNRNHRTHRAERSLS